MMLKVTPFGVVVFVLLAALTYYVRQVDKAVVLALREAAGIERVLLQKFPDLAKEEKK
jgi:hypothetical protein